PATAASATTTRFAVLVELNGRSVVRAIGRIRRSLGRFDRAELAVVVMIEIVVGMFVVVVVQVFVARFVVEPGAAEFVVDRRLRIGAARSAGRGRFPIATAATATTAASTTTRRFALLARGRCPFGMPTFRKVHRQIVVDFF